MSKDAKQVAKKSSFRPKSNPATRIGIHSLPHNYTVHAWLKLTSSGRHDRVCGSWPSRGEETRTVDSRQTPANPRTSQDLGECFVETRATWVSGNEVGREIPGQAERATGPGQVMVAGNKTCLAMFGSNELGDLGVSVYGSRGRDFD